ncbi:MAG TPA: autotransporter outer membrane beta-barrel domain-containing protein [Caulobacteraceae bacterium]
MTRKLLTAAASLAPLILVAGAAHAQVSITSATTTPVVTSTANNGGPAATVDVASGGSVGLTTPGVAVTINSNTVVTNEGQIGSTDINNATGVQLVGGNTGSFSSTGSILVTESYQAATDNNNGLLTGVYAQGGSRVGIQVVGGAFNGGITLTGSDTVHGNSSSGVDIETPITGSFLMQTVSPTTFTSSTTITVANGSISVLGNGSIGFYVAPNGGVGGNIQLGAINANGGGNTQGAVINGAVGGTINVAGAITATGYRTTTRQTTASIGATYTAQELQQGGSALTVGGNVGGGLIISKPPLVLSTTNPDLDGNGVPDSQQTAGSVSVFGAAPAFVIGTSGQNGSLGLVGPGNGIMVPGPNGTLVEGGANTYGLVIQGSVIGNGLFDQIFTPNIGGQISGTGLQIGPGDGTHTFVIAGGIYNSGLIEGEAWQASATAVHFINGGQTPQIVNDGSIFATSNQVTTGAGAQGFSPANVYGILVEKGATLNSITNNSSIEANITGSGGAGATEVGAIVDRSGTLSSVTNTGAIIAQATQTELSTQMPIGSLVAIDMSQGTGPQTLLQQQNPNMPASSPYVQTNTYTVGQVVSFNNVVYEALSTVSTAQDPVDFPNLWRPVGALTPSIVGNVYFGSGGTTVNIFSGSVTSSIINLGTGTNTLNVLGQTQGCTGVTCATVTGAIEQAPANIQTTSAGLSYNPPGPGQLTINVNNGTLTDLNPNNMNAKSINVGANGLLVVSADPFNGTHTEFFTSGASTFAQGSQVGVNLVTLQSAAQQTYTILQTVGSGTLTAGTFAQNAVGNAPFLYFANATFVPQTGGGGAIDLTVTRKTPQQLGFNTAEGNALDAVLAAAPQNAAIQAALLAQTTQQGLRSVYDQLLPNQGQGIFDALNAATEAVDGMISTPPDNGKRVAGSSLWLQEVNERVDRSGIDSPGSFTKLTGLIAGVEHLGVAGGAIGMTLAYYNDNEVPAAQQSGSGVVANIVEASLYYRRSIGGFTFDARGAFGGAFFNSNRTFLAPNTTLNARANYDGYYYDGHAGVSYQQGIGRFYVRPELMADYLDLHTGGYAEEGGGPGFDLTVASQNDSRLTGTAELALGRSWGQEAWVQSEVRFGVREVLVNGMGDTVAAFSGGGSPFFMTPDDYSGGWATVGFAIRAGSPTSYFALEGDGDFRNGEQIYDIRIAGRTIF